MPMNMQQTGSRRTRHVLLVVFLVVSVALMTLYAREGSDGPIHGAQNAVLGVTGGATAVTAGVSAANDAANEALGDATANPATLSALREQNEELRKLLADAEEYRQEAERLRGLLDMKQVSGVTGPTARIIGRSNNAWDQSVVIDLGSDNGVKSGMTIMGATGVVGQVSRTTANTATVRLLTDPNSGAAVMIQSTRKDGIVRGTAGGMLMLEDLDENVIPEVGDVIVTSGLGGSYERGLIVGSVVSVNKTASNPTGTILVNPNDSASVLEEVIVVFNAPDVAAAEKAAAEAAEKKAAEEAAAKAQAEAEYEAQVSGTDEEGGAA